MGDACCTKCCARIAWNSYPVEQAFEPLGIKTKEQKLKNVHNQPSAVPSTDNKASGQATAEGIKQVV